MKHLSLLAAALIFQQLAYQALLVKKAMLMSQIKMAA